MFKFEKVEISGEEEFGNSSYKFTIKAHGGSKIESLGEMFVTINSLINHLEKCKKDIREKLLTTKIDKEVK